MAISVVKNALGGVAWYLLAVAVAFAFTAYLAQSYKQYSKLRAFRGPPTSGWSNFWLVRAVVRQNTHIDFANVCEKYGKSEPIFKFCLFTLMMYICRH
jgi:hypothetical protein